MKRIVGMAYLVCLCIMLVSSPVRAAVPRVMVSDYSVEGETVMSGNDFTIKITLKNTAERAVKNIKMTIGTENGEFLPKKGAGSVYEKEMEAGGEKVFTFAMTAAEGLEEKAYKLSVRTEYESSGGMEYTVDEQIFLPVRLEQRVSVTDVFLSENNVELGKTVEISAMVNNLGDGMLYNVTAKVTGDSISESDTYVGNIESGKSGTIDFLAKAVKVTNTGINQIIISYEDREGNQYEEKRLLNDANSPFLVFAPVYEKLEKIEAEPSGTEIAKKAGKAVAVLLVAAALVFLVIQRRKKRRRMLEEFMEEINE